MSRHVILQASVVVALSSCMAINKDFANSGSNYNRVPLHRISIGDSKNAVISALGEPVQVIGSKQFAHGVVEVWAYDSWVALPGPDRRAEIYWLYYLNGKLDSWGRPGDWQKQADRIIEIRFR
jgi:hypothetical protein